MLITIAQFGRKTPCEDSVEKFELGKLSNLGAGSWWGKDFRDARGGRGALCGLAVSEHLVPQVVQRWYSMTFCCAETS